MLLPLILLAILMDLMELKMKKPVKRMQLEDLNDSESYGGICSKEYCCISYS